jgi:hypothetical protein
VPESTYTAIFYQKDRNLLSSSLETRIVDFRINVRRGVPDDVLTSQPDLFFPRWRKIHFFLTVDRVRELTFQSENFVACRSLEDEAIWNSYISINNAQVGESCSVKDFLGYQWTAKCSATGAPAKDLVALARFSQVTSSLVYLVRFVALALIVGAAGNGVWTLIEERVASTNTLPKPGVADAFPAEGANGTWVTMGVLVLAFAGVLALTSTAMRRIVRHIRGGASKRWAKIRNFFAD